MRPCCFVTWGRAQSLREVCGGLAASEGKLRRSKCCRAPAIAPLQDARHYFDYHHTAADTFDKVRFEELRRNLIVLSSLVYVLAQDEGQ